ncbi:hypothetical protein TruAng_010191 [Truncatella angustata]|nr:hypothetical protein TruAng_010191 [Truncatella angustata]
MLRHLTFIKFALANTGHYAVALGTVKEYYQIAYGTDTDKSFKQSVQFWGFLQLNVGVIADCAPTLKPIVGKTLGLSSYGKYGNYNGISRTGGIARATGRSGGTSRSRAEMDADSRCSVDLLRAPTRQTIRV